MNHAEAVTMVREIWGDDCVDCEIQYDKTNDRLYAVCDIINQRRLLNKSNNREVLLDMLNDYHMEKSFS